MVKQLNAPTENEIYNLLGPKEINSWTQEKVTDWLQEKGWGHFASTFEKQHICQERFFQITLAELVQYLPRTMTTYYERRRLLNEIRLLVPSQNGTKPTPTTPTNISINTNVYNTATTTTTTRLGDIYQHQPHQPQKGVQHYYSNSNERGAGIITGGGGHPPVSAGSTSSATSSISPSSSSTTASTALSIKTQHHQQQSPTVKSSSYSPKAALNKLKNTFRSSASTMVSSTTSPTSSKQGTPTIPVRVSSTPDKITKFWANYSTWQQQQSKSSPTSYSPDYHHQTPLPPPPAQPIYHQARKQLTDQRIQITGDKETWYSLNVTNMRDPVAIKQHILQRMNYNTSTPDNYFYFHENGPDPDKPMDPHELMYLCSIADYSANQRILIKPAALSQQQQQQQNGYFLYATPELGKSPTSTTTSIPSVPQQSSNNASPIGSPSFRPLCRNKAARSSGGRPYMHKNSSSSSSVGIQLSDPPYVLVEEERTPSPLSIENAFSASRQRTGSVPSIIESADANCWRRSQPDMDRLVQDVGLWAIAPTSCSTASSSHNNNNNSSSNKPTPPIPPPKDKEPKFWGERPPAEVVFNHMEQYFDSQDLDKEVTVVEPVTRKLTHTKSIRLVAREASRKLNKQRQQRSGSRNNNNMLRRKSTKLWGQKVVQVSKRLPCVSEQMRLSNPSSSSTTTITTTAATNNGLLVVPGENNNEEGGGGEVQWIRGKLIGKGSFGRVYLAFNVGTGEVIAVKQVEIPKTASDLLNQHQHDMVDSLYQEIMTLRDLDHENIVQYLGYGQEDLEGVINIFLEYVSGGSISSRLALHGALDETLTGYFTRQICSGLAYLHSKHILHRDIKAANILVEVDGICKISDFGLSKKNEHDEVYDQNSRMSLRGSIYWMAPEVVKNEPYSAKVDIWSLGCTVIEMLTGQRPWLSLNQIAALYNLGRMNSPTLPENISEEAQDFLTQCFIIDPCKRPTALELLNHPFLNIDPTFDFKDYVDKGKI